MTVRTSRLAIIADDDPAVVAHLAIPEALALAGAGGERACEWIWVPTATLDAGGVQHLASYDAVWCAPGSPYVNTEGVLSAISATRLSGRPFLGTCGGCQHAVWEYARSVWGIADAAHAELDPAAPDPVIGRLACSLVDVSGRIHLQQGTRMAAIYGGPTAVEAYHCRYGVTPSVAVRSTEGRCAWRAR